MVFHPKDSINRSSLTGRAIAIALIKSGEDAHSVSKSCAT